MTSLLEPARLQARLDELIAAHRVPGAAFGVLHGDDVVAVASGVVNMNTAIETTPDTLFQIGSITKVWTATLVMMLVDEGVLDLDQPVVTYLPEFKVADPDVTTTVTLRHLLSHSSGIGGDHILETGRGDDNLERYVETCAALGQEHELGETMSYCNTGFSVLGRVIEKVTGKTWDRVLNERIITPLGLTHTNTLPEEALLFRTAAGHVPVPDSKDMQLAPVWVLPRSAGPAGQRMLDQAAAHFALPTGFEHSRQVGRRRFSVPGEGKDRASRTGHPAGAVDPLQHCGGFRHLVAFGFGRGLKVVSTVRPDVAEGRGMTR